MPHGEASQAWFSIWIQSSTVATRHFSHKLAGVKWEDVHGFLGTARRGFTGTGRACGSLAQWGGRVLLRQHGTGASGRDAYLEPDDWRRADTAECAANRPVL